ncbi:hypothetical protein, partial [Paenilisteria weihenstephanensis]|uniref:hypothetical protein n=1 Tax=Listeria weihenstephanensis TaxID=1006155 RepID=UPI001F18FDE3
ELYDKMVWHGNIAPLDWVFVTFILKDFDITVYFFCLEMRTKKCGDRLFSTPTFIIEPRK